MKAVPPKSALYYSQIKERITFIFLYRKIFSSKPPDISDVNNDACLSTTEPFPKKKKKKKKEREREKKKKSPTY